MKHKNFLIRNFLADYWEFDHRSDGTHERSQIARSFAAKKYIDVEN